MLKLFEALATEPGIFQTHYRISTFLGFYAACTYHHLTHADLSVPISCSAEWQLQTRNPSTKVS